MLLLGEISFNPPKMQYLFPLEHHPGTGLQGEKSIRLRPIFRLAYGAASLGGAPTMKSFFLIAQAAVAEADEQKRSALVLFSTLQEWGYYYTSASFLSAFPGIGHLFTWESFEDVFFQVNFCGDTSKFGVNGKRGNCAQLEVGNRSVMLTVSVLKRGAAPIVLLLFPKKCV